MATLQITEVKAKKMDEVEDLSLDAVKDALKGINPADSEDVKLAIKTLSVVAKNRQTSTHRSALEFGMVSSVATEEQRKKYIAATNPQIQKAIAGK